MTFIAKHVRNPRERLKARTGSVVAGAVPSPGARSGARNAFPQLNHPAKMAPCAVIWTIRFPIGSIRRRFSSLRSTREVAAETNSATRRASAAIFEATRHYQDVQRWYCEVLLLMPDHVHMLVSFP